MRKGETVLKSKLVTSVIVLLVVVFSMAGGTVAWFTDNTTTDVQKFVVGTLKISSPELVDETGIWKAGQSVRLTYEIENLGDQVIYLRVKPAAEYIGGTTAGEAFLITAVQPEWITVDLEHWYYGQTAPVSLSPSQSVQVTFEVAMAADAPGTVNFTLEAQAIQASANALQKQWIDNPW